MLGMITLWIALGAQVAFLVYRLTTKQWQTKITRISRITAFITFSLLLLFGVYWWGFRWIGLFLLLMLLAASSVVRWIWKPKADRVFKSRSVVHTFISSSFLLVFCILPGILFPQLEQVPATGALAVQTQSVTLVDSTRVELYSQSGEHRKLTVQFWYPSDAQEVRTFPLVVFSHGAFGYRGSNLSTYKNLASNGYVVCSIDHSYHSFFVQHTDGSRTLVNTDFLNDAVGITNGEYDEKTTYEKTHGWLALRTADMNFVLDAILDAKNGLIPPAISSRIDPERLGLFGHSLGGATAAQLGRERSDVDAVAVIDGTMFGEEVSRNSDGTIALNTTPYPVPLLNLYNESHYADAHSQGASYANLSASAHAQEAYDVVVRGSGHLNFTDLPLFSPTLAGMLGVGSVDSRYCIETMNQIVLRFFDHTLKGIAGLKLQEVY